MKTLFSTGSRATADNNFKGISLQFFRGFGRGPNGALKISKRIERFMGGGDTLRQGRANCDTRRIFVRSAEFLSK